MKNRGTKTSSKTSLRSRSTSSSKKVRAASRVLSSKSAAISWKLTRPKPAFGAFPYVTEIDDFVASQAKYGEKKEDPIIEKVITYLGGFKVVKKHVRSASDVHDLIVKGLPSEAVMHVVAKSRNLDQDKVGRALGMSTRTIQRRKDQAAKPLSAEQGDRTWKFSELMVRATALLGSQAEAERWFDTPALGLDQRRPIDLMGSSVGAALVGDLLGRMEYGVYT